jgi:hypothetical protein
MNNKLKIYINLMKLLYFKKYDDDDDKRYEYQGNKFIFKNMK